MDINKLEKIIDDRCSGTRRKVEWLEEKIDAIAKHLGIEFFRQPKIQTRLKDEKEEKQ